MQPRDLPLARPCRLRPSFHGSEKNVRIFGLVEIVSKRLIPKSQHSKAKIEFETYIHRTNTEPTNNKSLTPTQNKSRARSARERKLYYFSLKKVVFIEVNDVESRG